MRINKDQARILGVALSSAKYRFCSDYGSNPSGLIQALNELQSKLEDFGEDQRRTGRTSDNSFNDCLSRFEKRNIHQ